MKLMKQQQAQQQQQQQPMQVLRRCLVMLVLAARWALNSCALCRAELYGLAAVARLLVSCPALSCGVLIASCPCSKTRAPGHMCCSGRTVPSTQRTWKRRSARQHQVRIQSGALCGLLGLTRCSILPYKVCCAVVCLARVGCTWIGRQKGRLPDSCLVLTSAAAAAGQNLQSGEIWVTQ